MTAELAAAGAGLALAFAIAGGAVYHRNAEERRRGRSVRALVGRHAALPAAAAQEVAEHQKAAEVWRTGEQPIVGEVVEPIVELSPVEPRRSDYARRVFEADPLAAPIVPDLSQEQAVLFADTIEHQTLRGRLAEPVAADLYTTGAWTAAQVRQLLYQYAEARR